MERYTLPLDAEGARVVVVEVPPSVTQAEFERIRGWLTVQLLVTAKV